MIDDFVEIRIQRCVGRILIKPRTLVALLLSRFDRPSTFDNRHRPHAATRVSSKMPDYGRDWLVFAIFALER